MFSLRIAVWISVLLLFVPNCVGGHDLSFTVTTKQDNEVATGTVYVKGQKYRIERDGEAEYAIVREDIGRSWLVNAEKGTYTEMLFNPEYRPRIDEKDPAEIERTYLGVETISGRKAFKYSITTENDKKRRKFYQWTDAVFELPVRIEDGEGRWTMEYSNFKRYVPDSLFDLPANYHLSEGWTAPFMRIYSGVWLVSGVFFAAYYVFRRLRQHSSLA